MSAQLSHWMNGVRQIINLIRVHCCTVKLISYYWAIRPRFLSTSTFTGSSISPLNLLHSSSPNLPCLSQSPSPSTSCDCQLLLLCSEAETSDTCVQESGLQEIRGRNLAMGVGRLVCLALSWQWQYDAAATTKYRHFVWDSVVMVLYRKEKKVWNG